MPDPIYHFDPEALYVALDKERRARRITWRVLCREAGVSASTITRIGQGHAPSATALLRFMHWLRIYEINRFARIEWKDQADA